mmetsp:Transcript_25450/g.57141  ORF Transcript_25450/g.57141 Transcript_25450/m.57141 type:complete len:208 (+) Transcript_25450:990-1613(+)
MWLKRGGDGVKAEKLKAMAIVPTALAAATARAPAVTKPRRRTRRLWGARCKTSRSWPCCSILRGLRSVTSQEKGRATTRAGPRTRPRTLPRRCSEETPSRPGPRPPRAPSGCWWTLGTGRSTETWTSTAPASAGDFPTRCSAMPPACWRRRARGLWTRWRERGSTSGARCRSTPSTPRTPSRWTTGSPRSASTVKQGAKAESGSGCT